LTDPAVLCKKEIDSLTKKINKNIAELHVMQLKLKLAKEYLDECKEARTTLICRDCGLKMEKTLYWTSAAPSKNIISKPLCKNCYEKGL